MHRFGLRMIKTLITILLLVTWTSAVAGADLDGALRGGDERAASRFLQSMTFAAARPTLEAEGNAGNTMAMWGMAEAWRGQNNLQMAAEWAYRAWLGTLLDGAGCTAGNAERNGMAKIFLAHKELLAWVRKNESIRRLALYRAGLFYKAHLDANGAQWVCIAGGNDGVFKNSGPEREAKRSEINKLIRFGALEAYFTKSDNPLEPIEDTEVARPAQ
jgi:hypothetical protein